jgi:hypothetical protein
MDNPTRARRFRPARRALNFSINRKKTTMKKSSVALLFSLLAVAGAASAQTPSNGIVMTHDREVAAKIEQHARDVQAQPVVQQEVDAPVRKFEQEPAHRHHAHRHGHHNGVKSMKAHENVEIK